MCRSTVVAVLFFFSSLFAYSEVFKNIENDNITEINQLIKDGVINPQNSTTGELLICAVGAKSYKVAKRLCEIGVPVNYRTENGLTALFYACSISDTAMIRLLARSGADLNIKVDGTTILHFAITDGLVTATKELLKLGSKPDLADESGTTPLILASQYGRLDFVKIYLEYGADINACDENGYCALGWAIHNDRDKIAYYLIEQGIGVNNGAATGDTPLFHAVNRCHVKMVKLLIEKGADLTIKDSRGKTPLEFAQRQYGFKTGSRPLINQESREGYGAIVHLLTSAMEKK